MVSLQNDFVCVLSIIIDCLENSFHIQCTCSYCCEHSYVSLNDAESENVSHNIKDNIFHHYKISNFTVTHCQ